MNLTKVRTVLVPIIDCLNKGDLNSEELVVVLAQLLIQTGRAIYDPTNKLGEELDWKVLTMTTTQIRILTLG